MAENQWSALVEAARRQIDHSKTDRLAAKEVLRQAAVAIRDVLGGRLPDPERREYLASLLISLEEIEKGEAPEKALALSPDHRPRSVSDMRDMNLFFSVGLQLPASAKHSPEKPVSHAIGVVARRFKLSRAVVEKAWKGLGGKRAWEAAASA